MFGPAAKFLGLAQDFARACGGGGIQFAQAAKGKKLWNFGLVDS